MHFPDFHHPITGTVIPVSALRSRESLGIGEFADLPLLGRYCVDCGIELIQILPVNDTGFERSPYSALSAFALHPVFARLSDFPEASSVKKELSALKKVLPDTNQVDFSAVLAGKLDILRLMWNRRENTEADAEMTDWEQSNSWVRNYALFSLLRLENKLQAWFDWAEYRNPQPNELDKLWEERESEARFWVWMQWRLEQQLIQAARKLDSFGIALKGDIPILINDDSADVWANRYLFRLDLRAGAPPDQYSADGQNWGFPTYDWDALHSNDFRWWRERLSQSAKYFHSFRIDHVLGFFRIWSVPEGDVSAMNGRYEPSVHIDDESLGSLGFDEARIRWLSQAHFPESELSETFGPEADDVKKMLVQVGKEPLWQASPNGPTEKEVYSSSLSHNSKELLVTMLQNITLRPAGDGLYSATWNFRDTRGWNSLSESEKSALGALIARYAAESERLWEKTGRELLQMMKGDGSQLVCAEDLGVVPESVPRVLSDLGLLGLKVTRWAREWEIENQPYTAFSDYPVLSVTTSSVHDSTTLRQWLAEEAQDDAEFRRVAALGDMPLDNPAGQLAVLNALQESASLVAAYPLQDLLALDPSCVEKRMEDERINVPGTVRDSNWSRRMAVTIESLQKNKKLKSLLKALCARRETRNARFPINTETREASDEK